MLVAVNIIWTGVRIVRKSVLGLMDTALTAEEQKLILQALEPHKRDGVEFHNLHTRQSGARQFVSLHVIVPDKWTVQRGHRLLEKIEADICRVLTNATVFTHLEAFHDPTSWEDSTPDRG
jgi:divalent metal cation (Fe/Co/Zn/Cd) transporter